MIMILMEWAYMATLSFLMGFACLAPFRKKGGCQIHSAVTYMMAGLLVLNVYAEYFSLFAGVGFWASLIAVFAAVIGGMLLRRDLADFFKISKIQACQKKTERSDEGIENSKSLWRKKNKAVWLLYAGLTLLFAYGSSRGYMHYDTGLYHAQAIRWIEEYGVVPGLANLHSRFGYNSASFALSAFFSETWLIGRPMHCVAGFFALLCACKCAAGLMAFWKRKKVRISDFLSDSSVPGDGFPGVRLFCNVGFILGNNDLGGTVGAGKGLSHRGKANCALRAAEPVSGVCGDGEAVHSGNFASGSVSGGVAA